MSKPVRLSPAKARDYLRAAREASFEPHEAVIAPDGSVRLIFGAEEATSAADAVLAEWKKRNHGNHGSGSP